MDKAKDRLLDMDLMREKRLILKLLEEIREERGLARDLWRGPGPAALKIGAVEALLVSEGLRKRRSRSNAPACGLWRR